MSWSVEPAASQACFLPTTSSPGSSEPSTPYEEKNLRLLRLALLQLRFLHRSTSKNGPDPVLRYNFRVATGRANCVFSLFSPKPDASLLVTLNRGRSWDRVNTSRCPRCDRKNYTVGFWTALTVKKKQAAPAVTSTNWRKMCSLPPFPFCSRPTAYVFFFMVGRTYISHSNALHNFHFQLFCAMNWNHVLCSLLFALCIFLSPQPMCNNSLFFYCNMLWSNC